jgi:hypothetical protein
MAPTTGSGATSRRAQGKHTSTRSRLDPERARLRDTNQGKAHWRRWGPYLADRQWGTVREDYSADGNAWGYFPHDHARSRAYRWGEDGLLGICDERARLCFALALWNGRDGILKERLFGLTGPQGNHGEDVKELYHYLDATPTASWLRALYRYPQLAFPYQELIDRNAARGRDEPEFELLDTGVFEAGGWFDVEVAYAKAHPDDIVIRIGILNQGDHTAPIHLLPTLWFRNTWAWGRDHTRPTIVRSPGAAFTMRAEHHTMGTWWLTAAGDPQLLLTENETNAERLWGSGSGANAVKDAFHLAIVDGDPSRLADPASSGTKAAAYYFRELAPRERHEVTLRLARGREPASATGREVAEVLEAREREADRFYSTVGPQNLTDDQRRVQRQAFAGLVWGKQTYLYDVAEWLDGDPAAPPPPPSRKSGRNREWRELNTGDVLSMPDTWEYPWFAAWDLAFHCVPFALIDPEFAKRQLVLLTREWYMHPNGQLPAYEWNFSDVNPPVHAWAAYQVYRIDRRMNGKGDRLFLERIFHKLLLNFTWWVNRKDRDGRNVFEGGFLGLDNIGVFDRSARLPQGGYLAQADGTAWMGFFSLSMLAIALELAVDDIVYEDVATKFLEHFLYIAGGLNDIGGAGIPLWDEEDGFFYDVLNLPDGEKIQLRVRSLVGLIPLLAVGTIEPESLQALPGFARRLRWFLHNRPDLASMIASMEEPGVGQRRLLALAHPSRLRRLLKRMLDPDEFLSPFGIRALSRYHFDHPYRLELGGQVHEVRYEPAESRSGMFGGNSNWRGPIWFPINYLLIEALERFHHYYGDTVRAEHPPGSGNERTLHEIATDLAERLTRIFLVDSDGRRPVFGADERFRQPSWRDDLLFYEYFHGDTGAGLGASHQTGWTALVAALFDPEARKPGPTNVMVAPPPDVAPARDSAG